MSSSPGFSFELLARCGETRARRGCVSTLHGSFQTPAFMPVGTRAAIKGTDPSVVRATGSEILLCNTYHLTLRPGSPLVAEMGGLHRFMRWDGPILTDSGGFQVFSLRNLSKVDDDGVTFRSHVNGDKIRLTPEIATRIQLELGSDIAMAFDECLPVECTRAEVEASLWKRTMPWALRCLSAHPRDGHALFGIVQGGFHEDLRQAHALELSRHPFDGLAVGGLSVGESGDEFRRILRATLPVLPESLPRYLMGVGSIPEVLEAIANGVDMFDCVLPTRNARNGQALTYDGPVQLRNARYAKDPLPIDVTCDCSTCARGFSRAYLRHLMMDKEFLGGSLITVHNLRFLQRVMEAARERIVQGGFDAWRTLASSRFKREDLEGPTSQ